MSAQRIPPREHPPFLGVLRGLPVTFVEPDDLILRQAMAPVQDPTALELEADIMRQAMDHGNGGIRGVGLAAPQLGIRARMFVMRRQSGEVITCINPRVIHRFGKPKFKMEGCLTQPGKQYRVARHEHVSVDWRDLNDDEHWVEMQGIDARCFQHELDHLDGRVVWPR